MAQGRKCRAAKEIGRLYAASARRLAANATQLTVRPAGQRPCPSDRARRAKVPPLKELARDFRCAAAGRWLRRAFDRLLKVS
jgi:hypothetical protein